MHLRMVWSFTLSSADEGFMRLNKAYRGLFGSHSLQRTYLYRRHRDGIVSLRNRWESIGVIEASVTSV